MILHLGGAISVTSEVSLPLEVLKNIRTDERTILVPFVILTSSIEMRDLTECYTLGANSYIRKTVDFVEFRNTMEQLGLYWLVLNVAPENEKKA